MSQFKDISLGTTLEQVRRYDTSFSYNGEPTDIVINVKKINNNKPKEGPLS